MTNSRLLIVALAASLAASLGVAGVASAQTKKVSYAEAWKLCKAELDQSGVYGTGLNAGARQSAGGACMHKHGFRLKKKSKI